MSKDVLGKRYQELQMFLLQWQDKNDSKNKKFGKTGEAQI
jgi:hypothetical protein